MLYAVALTECVRQVSVHCSQRGELLREILEILTRIWKTRAPQLQKQIEKERKLYSKEITRIKESFNNKIRDLKSKRELVTSI